MDGAWITCPVEVKRLEQKISGAIRRPERGCGEVEGMKEYIERAALKRELAPYEENDFSQQMDVM